MRLNSFSEFLPKVNIRHPIRGNIPFVPYPFQTKLAATMQESKFLVVNYSRQLGMSTMLAAYALWYGMSHADKTILINTNQFAHALEIMDRVRHMYETMESLKQGVLEYNKGSIKFSNGSHIIARAASSDAQRGLSVDLLLIDSASWIANSKAESYWASLQPVMNAGCRAMMFSSPGEPVGLFHSIFTGAPRNGFEAITIPWHVHPDRDDTWAEQAKKMLGVDVFRREYNCEFVTLPAYR